VNIDSRFGKNDGSQKGFVTIRMQQSIQMVLLQKNEFLKNDSIRELEQSTYFSTVDPFN
jgi:hypothetical protein